MSLGESPRIFDHTKQYACTEIFRLEELQKAVAELEDLVDVDEENFTTAGRRLFTLSGKVEDAIETIKEFLNNLEEQERR